MGILIKYHQNPLLGKLSGQLPPTLAGGKKTNSRGGLSPKGNLEINQF